MIDKTLCKRHKTIRYNPECIDIEDSALVKSPNCEMCKLETRIKKVFDLPQFRHLKTAENGFPLWTNDGI